MRIATYQDELDFPALLEELASGTCSFRYAVELSRWDALDMGCDERDPVSLMVRVWVPSVVAVLSVRLPWTDSAEEACAGIARDSRVVLYRPFERSYLDYPEGPDSGFDFTEQHVLYARGIAPVDGEA